VEITVLK